MSHNVGPFAANAGPKRDLLAPNVSRKASLFAGPGAAVCGPLHIAHPLRRMLASIVGFRVVRGADKLRRRRDVVRLTPVQLRAVPLIILDPDSAQDGDRVSPQSD